MPTLLGAQGRIEGQISNGTSGRPVANQEVRLLQPRQGMQQVAISATDRDGRFLFAESEIDPSSFYLVQTEFHGVHYMSPVKFESKSDVTVNLTVYESTPSDSSLRIQVLRVLVRAEGAKAQVREEFAVLNSAEPPRAYENPDGTFHFRLPSGSGEPTVVVVGLMNMPLPQTAEPGKSPGEFFIRTAFKPGITAVRVAYETEYTSDGLALSDRIAYPVDRAELYVSPSNLSVVSEVWSPAGLDPSNDLKKFEAQKLRRGAKLEAQISGAAAASPVPEAGPTNNDVKVVPNSMTRLGVPLASCFLLVLLWALGVRVAKEWPLWKERGGRSPAQKQLGAKVDQLVNSLADLDELFAARKISESKYWKERLELKARLVAILKKAPPALVATYATRHSAR